MSLPDRSAANTAPTYCPRKEPCRVPGVEHPAARNRLRILLFFDEFRQGGDRGRNGNRLQVRNEAVSHMIAAIGSILSGFHPTPRLQIHAGYGPDAPLSNVGSNADRKQDRLNGC